VGTMIPTELFAASPNIWQTNKNCLIATTKQENSFCSTKKLVNYRGNILRQNNGIYILKSNNNKPANAWWDINLNAPKGAYLVLISKTMPEEIRTYTNTGLPYIYGYLMKDTSNGLKITSYLQKDSMRSHAKSGKWDVSYGIFIIGTEDTQARIFLRQALNAKAPYNGTGASFKDVGVFVALTKTEAEKIVQTYNDSLK